MTSINFPALFLEVEMTEHINELDMEVWDTGALNIPNFMVWATLWMTLPSIKMSFYVMLPNYTSDKLLLFIRLDNILPNLNWCLSNQCYLSYLTYTLYTYKCIYFTVLCIFKWLFLLWGWNHVEERAD